MQALEIGHFWGVAGFYQGFKARLNQCSSTTTKNRLLTEQVGFGFFSEGCFDDTGAATAICRRVRQCNVLRLCCGILSDSDQAGHTASGHVGRAYCVTWSLGSNHDHVQILAGLDQFEVHIKTMSKGDGGVFFQIGLDFFGIEGCLKLVGYQHHHQIGTLYCFRYFCYGKAGVFSLRPRTRSLAAQRYDDVFYAGVA